jgi:serine-type D-Ala-D-Ala carboxypeptidase/endopeptidase (penicillin-binding protein 4)
MKLRSALLCLLLFLQLSSAFARTHRAASKHAPPASQLARTVDAILADPAIAHAHWGVSVIAAGGEPVYALNDGQFFAPASNAKLFTTAAALALLPVGAVFTTNVVTDGTIDANGNLRGNLILLGAGDANLSGRTLPYSARTERTNPPLAALEELAGKIAGAGVRAVDGDIIGDDSWFIWERYGQGWAWDDLQWLYGAPVSALTVNDNAVFLNILPGASAGAPGVAAFNPSTSYYTLENSTTTAPPDARARPGLDRPPGERVVRAFGTIGKDGLHAGLAIEDPGEFAALALKEMLRDRGIQVSGVSRAQHRLSSDTSDFRATVEQPVRLAPVTLNNIAPPTLGRRVIASHESLPLSEDLVVVNKVSQNLHAELLLRLLGRLEGEDGSIAQGARVVRQFLVNAGVRPDDFVFFDGSGMSMDDLVTPRAATTLLAFAARQPWGAAFRATLPVGGVDGSLAARFGHSALEGRVSAKTGTLAEVNSLSGYLTTAKGRTLIFSIFCNGRRPGSEAERQAIDKLVAAMAAAD